MKLKRLHFFLIAPVALFVQVSVASNLESEKNKQNPGLCLSVINAAENRFAEKISIWGAAYAGRKDFPRRIGRTGSKVFIFDPKGPGWAAYSASGRLIRTGHASGGKSYCPDIGRSCLTPTNRGRTFRIHSKRGAHCKSSKYPVGKGGAKMPYCMFFYHGYAIHGSHHVPPYNASHGCIRVLPRDAAWLHKNFLSIGTKVIVKPYGHRSHKKSRR